MSRLKIQEEIKTSMVFSLVFANKIFLSCFFFSLLIIDLYFLIPAVVAQIFYPTAEQVMLTRISTKKGKTEMEIHPVTAETKVSKYSI